MFSAALKTKVDLLVVALTIGFMAVPLD